MRRLLLAAVLFAVAAAATVHAMDYDLASVNGQSIMDVVVNILRTLMDLLVELIGRVLDEIVRAATNFMHGNTPQGPYGN